MADVELSSVANGSTARCRVVTRNGSDNTAATNKQPLAATDSYNIEAAADAKLRGDSIDIGLIQRRTYLLSAGIGDTNRVFNRFKGWIGLVIWILNVIIHFGLDFYEAVFVFEVSWATCIGVFLITLLACCYSMIKHSVPWFIKGVRKLKKDGHYPKTLRRVYLMFKVSLCTLSPSYWSLTVCWFRNKNVISLSDTFKSVLRLHSSEISREIVLWLDPFCLNSLRNNHQITDQFVSAFI